MARIRCHNEDGRFAEVAAILMRLAKVSVRSTLCWGVECVHGAVSSGHRGVFRLQWMGCTCGSEVHTPMRRTKSTRLSFYFYLECLPCRPPVAFCPHPSEGRFERFLSCVILTAVACAFACVSLQVPRRGVVLRLWDAEWESCIDALFMLGLLYAQGKGVEEDRRLRKLASRLYIPR
jgi:hypothetical protein